MLANNLLKHLTLRLLPESLLQPLRKAHYARKLLNAGITEPEMWVIPRLLWSGGCAIDLGANIGVYTRFLAEVVRPGGTVHAVEPVARTCDILRSNVRRLGLTSVTVHNLAVSDRDGTVAMSIPKYARGGDNLYEARIVEAGPTGTVQVPAVRLDDLFAALPRIDFVKCDVEGHELRVLRGAGHILHHHRPAWMMEVAGNPDDPTTAAAGVVRLMADAGYAIYHLENGGLRPRQPGDRANNYFFLRPEHVARLSPGRPL